MTAESPLYTPAPGTPCWIDLATANEQAARAFYAELFGWSYYSRPDPATGAYTIAALGGVPVAGLYRAVRNQPPSWTVHLTAANARSAAGWVTGLGGLVILEPFDIPGRGSIAHVQDPTGATFVLWEAATSARFGTGSPGMFTGTELNTHDGVAADAFYGKLFALTSRQVEGGMRADYHSEQFDMPLLHRYVMGTEYPASTPAHWLVYFTADPRIGADGLAEHTLTLGGQVVIAPYDTEFGRTAVLADPCGASFAVVDHTRAVEYQTRAEVDDPYDD
ncbi:MAG: VOC family protein [Actinophytocola sp.]|nr:VOC family protein [Actinophytocola sp.]